MRSLITRFSRVTLMMALGVYALVGGLTSFFGWALDVPRLTDWGNNGISIQPNASLCVTLSGLALLALSARRKRLATACGAVVALVGGATVFEWFTGAELGIDSLLLFGRVWGRVGVTVPGRMGPPGSLSWTLIGVALILSASDSRFRRWVPAMGLATMSISALSLVGYLYRVDVLFALPWLTVIAFQTATFVMAVSIGLVASVPECEPMRTLLDRGSAGILARRASPFIVLVPVGLGLLQIEAQRAGWIDTGTGIAILVISLVALQASLIWWSLAAVRRYEQALVDSEQSHRAIFDTAVDSIITIDERGIVRSSNPAVERLFGYRADELIGQNIKMLMPRPYHEEHDNYLANYLRTGERKIIGIGREVLGKRRDGTIFPVELAVSELTHENQRVFTGIIRDITERKRAEEALRDADRRKDEFLATLSHELRNPLAPVLNALELLDHFNSDEAVVNEARETMRRQMTLMVRLIDDLLDVSRISRGTIELRKERVELQALVQQTIDVVGPMCDAAGQRLIVDLPQQPVWMDADPVRLNQVLGNLLTNASRYSDRNASITLSAQRIGSDAILTVKDTGIGIPPDKLQTIFEIFSQVDRSLERSAGGLGIGLYLVKQLVEKHGGTVTAHSEGQGMGSEFVIRMPIVFEPRTIVPPTASPAATDGAPRIPRQRILVVDDNLDAARTMTYLLRAYGHDTQMAHDGLEALEAAKQFRPEIILMDIGLPSLNGYEACLRIRSQPWGEQTLLIAITGWGQEEDKRRAIESGFDAHLTKPVEPAELKELLASLLKVRVQSRAHVALNAEPS